MWGTSMREAAVRQTDEVYVARQGKGGKKEKNEKSKREKRDMGKIRIGIRNRTQRTFIPTVLTQ